MPGLAESSDPTQRFTSRVGFYVPSRPHYPKALFDFCHRKLGLNSNHAIADIGSGTGILSELFVPCGNPVFAIEPNDAMGAAAEKEFANFTNFHSISATADKTGMTDKSVDFVMAGQAFHWFKADEAKAEFRRILRPGGWVVLVWNERDKSADRFSTEYDAVVQEFQLDWHKVKHERITSSDKTALNEFFAPAEMKIATFDNPQPIDEQGVLARALSSSYLPLPGQPRCDEMLARLRQVFRNCAKDGKVVQTYQTKVYYGQVA